jgi:hypothetical protein
MPFRSTAQQRFMYSQHPEIAQRWSNEMKGSKRKGAKQHPIKAAHLPDHVDKADTSYSKLPRKVHGRGRPSSRYGGTPGHGRRMADEEVEKAFGNWKTIEQREQHQRRDKKIRGAALTTSGAGSALVAGSIHRRRLQGGNAVEDAHNIVHPHSTVVLDASGDGYHSYRRLNRMRPTERMAALPHGTGVLTGGALVAGGLAAAAGATGMKAYHQSRINQRRRANQGRGSRIKKAEFTPTAVLSRTKPIAQIAADGGAEFGPGHQAAQALQPAKPAATQASAGAAGRTNALAGKLTGLQAQKPLTGQAGTSNGKGLASMGAQKPQQPVQSMGSIGSMSKSSPGPLPRTTVVRTRRRSNDPEHGRQFRLGAATAGTAAGGGSLVARGTRELVALNRSHGGAVSGLPRTRLVNLKGGGRVGVGIAGLVGASQLARYAGSSSNRRWT